MVEPPRVTAVLVDFDGTLVSLPVEWALLRADLARVAAGWGIDASFRSIADELRSFPGRARMLGWSDQRIGDARRIVYDVIREHELRAVPGAAALPGSGELLHWARTSAVPIGIVSANCVATIEGAFRRLGWPLPAAVVGGESVSRPKPDPEGALAALRSLGISGAGVLVIGDSDHDMLVGSAIGARTFRVATGKVRRCEAPADVELTSLEELLPLLQGTPV